ncbi:MAG: DUF1501 domain-containing protein [Blastocatellia bacterium]|nr:DUF1501 domain-containing protein [Blastocatellia bacterium]
MSVKLTSRRDFLKKSFGFVTAGVVLPHLGLSLFGQEAPIFAPDPNNRKIFLVIQFAGANDGLNTVIPYTDPAYLRARPNLGLTDKDGIIPISDKYALHPQLDEVKKLFDEKKVAIVHGVGYPSPNLSHFRSQDIWHTANPTDISGEGWLGKYVELAYGRQVGLGAVSVGSDLPKTLLSDTAVIPAITSFQRYSYQTDSKYTADGINQQTTFTSTNSASGRTAGSLAAAIAATGTDAVSGAKTLQTDIAQYKSSVTYPNNKLAAAMKMLAQVVTTSTTTQILYASLGGFDTHSNQYADTKTTGDHANLLKAFSEAVDAFYRDMAEHGLADKVVMMQWSEFGRRVNENGSKGCDHGTAAPMFIIGNPIKGGIYGDQPSLTDLDSAGNMKFKVDFRSVYGTILDKWLGVPSAQVLGGTFENVGFLG